MKRWTQRLWSSPKLIPALTVLAVASLLMSTFVIVQFARAQSQRERDRIDSDVDSCERGNVGRQSDINIAHATEDMVDGILDEVFAGARDQAAVDALRGRLEPVFQRHRDAVAQIQIIDCRAVVPGAKESP